MSGKRTNTHQTFVQHERLRPLWRMDNSHTFVTACFFIFGCLFVVLGILLVYVDRTIIDCRIPYKFDKQASYVLIVVREHHCQSSSSNHLKSPVFLQYELKNFFQNHRKYISSRSDLQVQHSGPNWMNPQDKCAPRSIVSDILFSCSEDKIPLGEVLYPLPRSRINPQLVEDPYSCSESLYPCGMVATTVFSDSYRLYAAESNIVTETLKGSTTRDGLTYTNSSLENYLVERKLKPSLVKAIDIDSRPGTIAWKSDLNVFKPAPDITDESYRFYDWLDRKLFPEGVLSGHFLVWFRSAGLPHFRKLWGRMNAGIDLPVIIEIENNYATASGSEKAVVISTVSIFGGRSLYLGVGYILVGSVALICGMVFVVVHIRKKKITERIRLSWD